MHRWMKRSLVTAFTVTASLASVFAFAGSSVTIALTADRLVETQGHGESREPAEKAKPGDVIEYRATYRNQSDSGVKKLDATLPIPAGTEYLAKSAVPAANQASLDGHTFESIPLMRKVKLDDGREVMREVPAAEYRFLRWSLGTLGAHGQQSVRARVRVSTGPVSAAQR
jgi:uncharacterized repeat protein (TIGR01451 family)